MDMYACEFLLGLTFGRNKILSDQIQWVVQFLNTRDFILAWRLSWSLSAMDPLNLMEIRFRTVSCETTCSMFQ